LVRRLGGSQSQFGRGDEEKKSHYCPLREFNIGSAARILFTIPTELSRLLEERWEDRKEGKDKY
jgi:hypothetical protein